MRTLVVIGGSSGALDAILELVPALPQAAAVPIVVVLHVAPHHASVVPQLIARASSRRVIEIEDKTRLEPGVVYVAPPDYHVLVERDGSLALSIEPPVNCSRPSIDALFESAAAAYGPAVIEVVLSGANEDGADGLCCIARAGGVAIVQDPQRAPLATMPAAARDRAGPGTHVLEIFDMAALIAREVTT